MSEGARVTSLDAESLTPDGFMEELRERFDALRWRGVEVPDEADSAVLAVVSGFENPFEEDLFRAAAAHLLDGLDPDMAVDEQAKEILGDRVWELPANLRIAMRVAAERLEQPV